MEAFEAIGGSVFLLVSTVLAVRLLLLAHRSRALPELLLGIAFLSGGSLGALVEAGAQVAEQSHATFNTGALLAVGKAFGLVGISANCFFVWYVFRRSERWALSLAIGLVALQLVGYAGHAMTGAFATGRMAGLPFWIEFVGRIVSPAWLGIEAAVYGSRMSRRVKLGLADPIVSNRFLLWALASCTSVCFLLTSVPPVYLDRSYLIVRLDMLAFAAFGIASASAYWLAFFPPARYRRWIESRAPARV